MTRLAWALCFVVASVPGCVCGGPGGCATMTADSSSTAELALLETVGIETAMPSPVQETGFDLARSPSCVCIISEISALPAAGESSTTASKVTVPVPPAMPTGRQASATQSPFANSTLYSSSVMGSWRIPSPTEGIVESKAAPARSAAFLSLLLLLLLLPFM